MQKDFKDHSLLQKLLANKRGFLLVKSNRLAPGCEGGIKVIGAYR
jgi:hypothetical protein